MKKNLLFFAALSACLGFCVASCDDDSNSGSKSCLSDADCGDLKCNVEKGVCFDPVPAHCKNAVKDKDETGTDCGGSCGKCQEGEGCLSENDCISAYCNASSMTCTPKPCDEETTCGGEGGKCDLDQGVCISCEDAHQNGDETDLNCGGSCSRKCEAGQKCLEAKDCITGLCDESSHLCAPKAQSATLGNLFINEVSGANDAKKPFTLNDNAAPCEFIEIANVSSETASMDEVELELLRTDDGKNKVITIPLIGAIYGKGVYVVHNCEELPLPDDAVGFPTTTLKLTDAGTYDIKLKNASGESNPVSVGPFKKSISFNRDPDFDSNAEMNLHNEISSVANASPGYCANGGLYSEGCQVSGGGGGEGGADPVDLTKLFINEVNGKTTSKATKPFTLNSNAEACEFVEIAYSDTKEASLDGVELVLHRTDKEDVKSVPLTGTLSGPKLIVVHNCAELPLPSDAVGIKSTKLSLTDSGAYDLYLKNSSSETAPIQVANFKDCESFNRSTDLDKDELNMWPHSSLEGHAVKSDGSAVLASPGYCNNGGLYSQNCAVSGSSEISDPTVPHLLFTEVLVHLDANDNKFEIHTDADVCKFIEFVNTDSKDRSLDGVSMFVDDGEYTEIPLDGHTIKAHNAFVVGTCDTKAEKANGGLGLPDGVGYLKVPASELVHMPESGNFVLYFGDDVGNEIAAYVDEIYENPAQSNSLELETDLVAAEFLVSTEGMGFLWKNTVGLCNNGALYTDMCELKCSDNQKQFGETDLDCGGVCLEKKCTAGQMCRHNTDCNSSVCNKSVSIPVCQ